MSNGMPEPDSDLEQQHLRRRLNRIAYLMDKSIPLPGGLRIGLDGLIGLIPGVGDALTSTVSGWIIFQARRAGAPMSLILRMLLNVFVDFLFGLIPLAGDLFDFAFKANLRNIDLLERYLDRPRQTRRRSRLKVAIWGLGMAILLVAVVYILFVGIRLLIEAAQ